MKQTFSTNSTLKNSDTFTLLFGFTVIILFHDKSENLWTYSNSFTLSFWIRHKEATHQNSAT